MKDKLKKFGTEVVDNTRAVVRLTLGTGLILLALPAAAIQAAVIGPVLKNYTAFPRFCYNAMRVALGIKVEEVGPKVDKDQTTWFWSNHLSRADFIALGSPLDTTFVMVGRFFKNKLLAPLFHAARLVGTRQTQESKATDMGKLLQHFNEGTNVTMFPEGTNTNGKQVCRFSAGFASLLFNEAGKVKETGEEIKLEKHVVVQPIAMRVKEVNGKNVLNDKDEWGPFTMENDPSFFRRTWNRLKVKSMTIELTYLPAMDPKDYTSHVDFTNAAHAQIVSVVAPDQKVAPTRKEYNEAWAQGPEAQAKLLEKTLGKVPVDLPKAPEVPPAQPGL